MKALVYHGPKKVSVDTVPDPKIEKLTDVIIKLTNDQYLLTSASSGSRDRRWERANAT